MNENERYMRSVAVRDVPWHRLTTPYGRASEFPRFFAVLETMRDRAAADEALYLWSKVYDEDADERRWEDDDVFPDDLFYSFYYYSYQALLSCRSVLGQAAGSPLGARAAQLEEMLRRR